MVLQKVFGGIASSPTPLLPHVHIQGKSAPEHGCKSIGGHRTVAEKKIACSERTGSRTRREPTREAGPSTHSAILKKLNRAVPVDPGTFQC